MNFSVKGSKLKNDDDVVSANQILPSSVTVAPFGVSNARGN